MRGARFLLLLVFLASCARQQGDVNSGGASAIKGIKDPVSDLYAGFIYSELERYSDDPAESLDAINKAIEKDPTVGYFYYQRALIRAGGGDWESVVADCLEALKKDSQNIDAEILLGKALGATENRTEAIRHLEKALKEDPSRKTTYQLLAKEYMNLEKYREAERVMKNLIAKDSEEMVAYYYLGAIYGAYLKQPARAIEVYKKILDREPENLQVIDTISQLYIDMGRSKKALRILLDAEKQRPADIGLKLKIAQIYYRTKDYRPAIERFNYILENNPKSDKIIYYLGVLYEESGDMDKSIEMFQRVPPDSGLYKDARLRLAYRYKNKNNLEKAKDSLLQAIKRDPKVLEFYQYLSGIYERAGDFKSAVKVLDRAKKYFPSDPNLFLTIGTLYDKIGDYDKAISAMKEVIKLDPKNAFALNYVGYMLLESGGNIEEAEDMLQEAVQQKPGDGYIVDSLGWLYFKKGDYTKAYLLVKRALEFLPNEPTILKHMGEIYLVRGEKAQALKHFKKALDSFQKKESVNVEEVQETVQLIEKAMGSGT